MCVQTKRELLEYLRDETKTFDAARMERFSANAIGKKKNISRTLVSQYLNELFKEGQLIKINSRPVYFLHKEMLELHYETKLSERVYFSVEELMEEILQTQYQLLDFGRAIGNKGSLGYCVEQCKAAISYPTAGLPILLTGDNGTGKSYFARLTYEYAVNHELVREGRPFYVVDCSEYAQAPEKLRETLFGKRENGEVTYGLLEQAEGSVLFFDEAHNLSSECQEQLFSYLDEGRFHRMGDKEQWVTTQTRLIFATMKNPEDVFLRTFLRRIPVIVHLPGLSERSYEEKEEMIVRFFKREGRKTGREILVSRRALNVLLNHAYPGNIGELDKIIRTSCSAAWLNREKGKELVILLYHLPEQVLATMKAEPDGGEETQELLRMSNYERDGAVDRTSAMFDELLDLAAKNTEDMPVSELIDAGMRSIQNYYDYLIFKKNYVHTKVKAVQEILAELFARISERYAIILPANCSLVVARSIFTMSQDGAELGRWEMSRKDEIEHFQQLLSKEAPRESLIASELLRAVQDNLELRFHKIHQIFMTINIAYYNRHISINETAGIIISHGYSTASSIADTVNKLLGTAVFYAMDMPLEMKTEEIAFRLKKHIECHDSYRNIILLVDMGSLEEIGGYLQDISNIHLGIINNVSTQMALEVGSGILRHAELEEILKDACENIQITYRAINTQKKEPVILFTSEMGLHAAERMQELFGNNLSGHGKIRLVLCDFGPLLQKQDQHEWFEKYKVLCVIGTMDPGLKRTPFFALDALISGDESKKLGKALASYLTETEIEALSDMLLKNFSLQNVVQNLTILNADTLLGYVMDAVCNLQGLLEKQFDNRTLTSFYVHLSCMVERLVTKSLMNDRAETDFEKTHSDFVQKTRNAFQEIERHYQISLPISEIEFLYDYIENEEKRSKKMW